MRSRPSLPVLLALGFGLLSGAARAQDPLPLYPENYRVLTENDRVRVLDFRLAKGATEQTHSHPAHVAVFLVDVKIRFTLPDGSVRIREAKAGETVFSEPTAHASENIGDHDAHGILVELKSQALGTAVGAAMPPTRTAELAAGIRAPRTDDPEILAATLIHGLAGNEADLKQHLLSLAAPTRAEDGCLQYDLYQSPTQPHEFLRVERWASNQALEHHKQAPHLRASFDKRQREGWTTQINVFQRVPEDLAATVGAVIERLDPRLDDLLPTDARLDVVADGQDWCEGPLWDVRDGSLLFSDVPRNGVFRWKEGAGVAQFLRGSGYTGGAPFEGREPGSNGLAFDREGRLLLCQHGDRRVARRELDGRITVLADRYRGKRLNSPNDLVLGPDGNVYFTDPPFGLPGSFDDPAKELPHQGVYRLGAGGKLTLLVKDLGAPNGLGFSPDGTTLYVSNAQHARPIWMAYPVKRDGSLGPGRQFAEAAAYVREGEGVPDGLKLDARGNLFACGPGGVHIYAPDGTRLGRIITGVPTGNVAWGEDGGTLFVAANHRILRLRTGTQGAGWTARAPAAR